MFDKATGFFLYNTHLRNKGWGGGGGLMGEQTILSSVNEIFNAKIWSLSDHREKYENCWVATHKWKMYVRALFILIKTCSSSGTGNFELEWESQDSSWEWDSAPFGQHITYLQCVRLYLCLENSETSRSYLFMRVNYLHVPPLGFISAGHYVDCS